jgi:hypothetical protein
MDWWSSLAFAARGLLWTGNNYFLTFSRFTLNAVLALLSIGVVCAMVRYWRVRAVRILMAYSFWFGLALLYSTALSFAFTQGASAGASPWYAQFLFPIVLSLAWLGLEGGWVAARYAQLLAMHLYLIPTTYFVKLLPLYGWGFAKRATGAQLADWYFAHYTESSAKLDLVCLALGRFSIAGALLLTVFAALVFAVLVREVSREA